MERCDVIVAGGGPAGSTCAWALSQAGFDVIVIDRATFPRDKVCAGWIPPQVLADLHLDVEEYRRGRTFQPFTAFRIGMIGDQRRTDIDYEHPVSFGITRCEFDGDLLQRSSARLQLGTAVARVRRHGSMWTAAVRHGGVRDVLEVNRRDRRACVVPVEGARLRPHRRTESPARR
jgi:flavin-dependent dehydrogenase